MSETEERVLPPSVPAEHRAGAWQILWFLLHLAAVYAIVQFFTPWLAGWTGGRLLPLLRYASPLNPFEFFCSHIFAFSFVPAFLFGLVNARFKHKVAQFVWLPPALILAYKFVTFPAASVFASQSCAAFHQYFGGGFLIPGSWTSQDFRSIAESSDTLRGLAQFEITAPFYAGVGYSLAAWIGLRTNLTHKISEQIKEWEASQFGDKAERAEEPTTDAH